MAHGVSDVLSEGSSVKIVIAKQQNQHPQQNVRKTVGVMGSRRIFAPAFKLKVLDSYRNDIDCRGNQRATARKYGIHRRQIQKWLQCEDNLRSSCPEIGAEATSTTSNGILKSEENSGSDISPSSPALNLSLARLHGDELPVQQGSPPSQPPSRNSPLTAEFGFLPTLPRVAPVGYSTPDLSDLKENHKFLDESERKFYVPPERYELESTGFHNRGEVKLYQTLTPYHSPQEHSYDNSSEESQMRNYESVDSPEDTRITRAVLNAPAEIKAERASPDSAATPGMYEMPGSPSASLVSFLSPHQTSTTTNSPTPHFELTQQTSPSVHVYVREHLHLYQIDSKKPCCQEEEKRETKTEELEFKKEEEEEEEEVLEQQHKEAVMRDLEGTYPLQHPPQGQDSYSESPSPHGPVSSSSSCSDSEIDAIDNSPYQPTCTGLTRRRSFSLRFKINVLDAFHQDVIVSGNQRATARKFGINRRQVQKWLGQETELRGEIARRGGNSRQRLGSNQELPTEETPVDLRVGALYCCEASPTRQSCTLSCCTDNAICYQENLKSYKDTTQYYSQSSDNKRPASSLFCCYRVTPSPKKMCLESKQNHLPPQETPLCLVKPKMNPAQIEIVTSTVQTPPAPVTTSTPPSSKKDAILFKPYLDNPISKPTDDSSYQGLSMMNTNNNNNCQGICNLNEGRGYDYALELSLRVPISWRAQHTSYCDFPPVRSAFVRYPASPHYT